MSIEYSALNLNATTGFVHAINDDMTLYVATNGDDEKNTGLSKTSPFATPHRALEYLHDKFITGNAVVTISCEEGVYTFSKPIHINESGLKGYYADVTFRNPSKERAELFAISSEAVISSK